MHEKSGQVLLADLQRRHSTLAKHPDKEQRRFLVQAPTTLRAMRDREKKPPNLVPAGNAMVVRAFWDCSRDV